MIPRESRTREFPTDEAHAAVFRGRQVSGLLLLGGIILAVSLFRANWHDLFPTGWWHVW